MRCDGSALSDDCRQSSSPRPPSLPLPLPPLFFLPLILASLFKQSGPRSPGLQSSFPTGLQPVASRDINGILHRRSSRTDLDFEQALRAGGTVLLKEGPDVDALGADISLSSVSSLSSPPSSARNPYGGFNQPATPTVIPATPSPTSAVRTSNSSNHRPPSQSSSTEIFYDAEDSDFQTKRRSMYRSPGTASSPDLATLLKKAKERGATGNKDGRKRPPTSSSGGSPHKSHTHDSSDGRGRERSSASSGFAPSPNPSSPLPPNHKGKGRASRAASDNRDLNSGGAASPNPDWVFTSPRSLSAMIENGKVRAYTKLITQMSV